MFSIPSISTSNRVLLGGDNVRNGGSLSSFSRASYSNTSWLYAFPSTELYQPKRCPRLVHTARRSERCIPVRASGEKGKFVGGNEPFSWDSLKKVFGGFKRELTVQDMLREQARQKQFDGSGGDGNSGGDGGGGGSSGPEDEGFAGIFNEFLDVLFAVIGVVILYILMISGEELILIARDYIKYLFGVKPSVRLTRCMKKFSRIYKKLTRREVIRKDWLERKIIATPTWWHKPRLLANLYATYYEDSLRQNRRNRGS